MYRYSFILFLLNLSFWSNAQDTFSIGGKVWDVDTRQPLPGIAVYINGTTYSTQSEKDGSFLLSDISLTLIELTFSAINYETQAISIDLTKTTQPLHIHLKKSTAILDEVVVTTVADKNDWSVHGNTFKNDYLGYSAFSKKCAIIHSSDIKFRNIKKNNTLRAYSKVPIKILNKALGYELNYWLEDYEHQFSKQIVSYKGYTQFTELKGTKKQKTQWLKNRNTAYKGSLTHFLKSLYERNTSTQGFVINLIKTVDLGSLNFYLPVSADTVKSISFPSKLTTIYAQQKDTTINALQSKAGSWLSDKYNISPFKLLFPNKEQQGDDVYYCIKDRINDDLIYIYQFRIKHPSEINKIQWQTAGTIIPDQKSINRINGLAQLSREQKNSQKIQLYYNHPLNPDDFLFTRNGNTYLQFSDNWQITYTKELQENEYIVAQSLDKTNPGYQTSVLSMVGTSPIRILPNGYTPEAYSLITGAYWSYEKIDKMLPVNYKPN